MATIASLDIGTALDTSGIGRGVSAIEQQLAQAGARINGKNTGFELADDIISGATKQLLARQNEMQEALEQGLLNPSQLAEAAEKAGKEYKSALAKGVGNLAVQHLVTDEVRQKFEVAFGRIGNSAAIAFNNTFAEVSAQIDTQIAGAQFAGTAAESLAGLRQAETVLQAALKTTTLTMEQRVQVAAQLERVQGALATSTRTTAQVMNQSAQAGQRAAESAGLMSRFINRSTGDFTALGRRASGALVGISFALDGIVQGGGKAIDSVHGVLRTVASVAPAFGPEGLIVSAVAAGTDAIIGMFTETRTQMEKTQDDFERRLKDMQDAADSTGLQHQIEIIDIGAPSGGKSLFGEFNTGGLLDLRAQLALAQKQLDAMNNNPGEALAKGLFAAGKSAESLEIQIASLNKQIDDLEAKRARLTKAVFAPAVPVGGRSGLIPEVDTEASIKAVDDLVDHLTRGMAALAAFGAAGPTVHMTGVVDAVRVPRDLPPVEVPLTFNEQQFQDMAKRLADLDSARKATQSAGLDDEAALLAAKEAAEVLALTAAWRKYVETLIAGGASAEELAAALQMLENALKKAGADGKDIGKGLERSGDGLDAAAQAAHRLGNAMGGVGDNIADVLSSIDDVKRALATMKAPDLNFGGLLGGFSSIFGGAVGIFNTVSGLMGPSPLEQERNRILQQNNDALEALKASVDRSIDSAGNVQDAGEALARVRAAGNVEGLANSGALAGGEAAAALLRKQLKEFGSSFAELDKIAKDNGITLLDEKGRLVAGSLEQLQEALGITTDILTTWGKSFDDQQRLADLARHAGLTENTPADQLADTVKNLEAQVGPAFAGFLSSFDEAGELASADARERLRKVIQQMVVAIQNKAITLDDIPGFKDVNEFGGALDAALNGLDAFDEGLGKVTDSLLNVPEIFKLARVRFESALPEDLGVPQGPPVPPVTVPPEPPVVIPPLVFDSLKDLPRVLATLPGSMADSTDRLGNVLPSVMRGALDGASVGIQDNQFDALLDALRATVPTGAATDRGGDTNFNGPIYVDARTKSVDQALDEMVEAMRRRSRAGALPLAGVRIT